MARLRETTRYRVEEIQAKAQEDVRYTLPALAVRPAPHPPRDRRGALESHDGQHLLWQEKGWWDPPPGRRAQQAKAIYER